MEETRNKLRSAALKRRAALHPSTCGSWSRLIQAKTLELPQYLAARTVAVYRPMGAEVDTGLIIAHALAHGKTVFVPASGTVEPGMFVPVSSREERPRELTDWSSAARHDCLVVIPGVLFDFEGNRLGRGGGWYDRTLHRLGGSGTYVGLAYELQVVPRLPAQPWDERVHYVVTESRVIDCGVQPQGRIAR